MGFLLVPFSLGSAYIVLMGSMAAALVNIFTKATRAERCMARFYGGMGKLDVPLR